MKFGKGSMRDIGSSPIGILLNIAKGMIGRGISYVTAILFGASLGVSIALGSVAWPWRVVEWLPAIFLCSLISAPTAFLSLTTIIIFYVYVRFEVKLWLLAIPVVLATLLSYLMAKSLALASG